MQKIIMTEDEIELKTGFTLKQTQVLDHIYNKGLSLDSDIKDLCDLFQDNKSKIIMINIKNEYIRWKDNQID